MDTPIVTHMYAEMTPEERVHLILLESAQVQHCGCVELDHQGALRRSLEKWASQGKLEHGPRPTTGMGEYGNHWVRFLGNDVWELAAVCRREHAAQHDQSARYKSEQARMTRDGVLT